MKKNTSYFILYDENTGDIKTSQNFVFESIPLGLAQANVGNIRPNLDTQNYDAVTESLVNKDNIAELISNQCKLKIRYRRNAKLANSDWTQLSDVDLTAQEKTDWQVYRQQLRDFMSTLPAVIDKSYVVTWPIAPRQ